MNFTVSPPSLLASLDRKPAERGGGKFAFLLSIHLVAILRVSILTAGTDHMIEVMTLMMTV